MNVDNLTPNQLRQAADLKEKIAKLQQEISRILGGVSAPAKSAAPKAKVGMSAEAKANQSAKMKAYWAAKRAAKGKPATKKIVVVSAPAKSIVKPAKKVMSAATKAKLRAKLKAYWAAKKRK